MEDIIKSVFFDKKEDIIKIGSNKINSNKRYPHFFQVNFTAGDKQQFQESRDYSNSNFYELIDISSNLFYGSDFSIYWEKYKDISEKAIDNTFDYIFNKMKKAVFVKIQNNKIKTFLPFSNVVYKN
jgi:ribosomal protein S17